MNIAGDIIKYVQQSEHLIIITVVVTISGLICYFGERIVILDFTGLPIWVRPTCTLVWVLAAVHVGMRLLMWLGQVFQSVAKFAADFPYRRRQAEADRSIVNVLLGTDGLSREVLCYARHREDNHIWTDGRSEPRWLIRLIEAGLVEMTDATFGSAHYQIHRIAWQHMRRYPNRFLHKLPWREPPWTERLNEIEIERLLKENAAAAS